MISKLKSTAGETIAEVLAASLIVMLGVLLYSMMVTASFRILTTAENRIMEYYRSDNAAEMGTPVLHEDAPINIEGVDNLIKEGDTNDISVDICGNEDVMSYRYEGE